MARNQHTLSKKLPRAAAKKKATKNTNALHSESAKFPLLTADRRPTYAGIHRYLWKSMCSARKWSESTAERYETIADRVVLPAFNHSKAFEDLTEDDVFAAWDKIMDFDCSKNDIQVASIVIRLLFDLAYTKGLCQLTLWGMPLDEATTQGKSISEDKKERNKDNRKGNNIAKEVFQPRSFPLETELDLINLLIKNSENYGEFIAALIMLCTGARTSEACGLRFKHFQYVIDDYWTLVRVDTLSRTSREFDLLGGKTNNSYRYLFVPPFLARLLQKRLEHLKELFPKKDLSNFPIACKGREYTKPCSQKDLNKMLKLAYKEAGLDEEIMRHAYKEVRLKHDDALDAELIATAYLCRKHFATTALACGLNIEELCIAMGHSIPTARVLPYDSANPAFFRNFSDKLRRWPIVQILDNTPNILSYEISTEGSHRFVTDFPTEICVSTDCSFHLDVESIAPDDKILINESDIQHTYFHESWLPETPEQLPYLNPKRFLFEHSMSAWSKTNSNDQPIISIPASTTKNYNWTESLNTSAPRKAKENPFEYDDTNVVPEYASSHIPLYAIYANGLIEELVEPQPIKNLSTAGIKITNKNSATLIRLLVHDRTKESYVLSADGILFKLSGKTQIDSHGFCKENNPAYMALLSNGILLQDAKSSSTSETVVCITDKGHIRRLSTKNLQRFPFTGRQLLTLTENERIVDACLCDEKQDILVVTERGQALRIHHDTLLSVSTIGSSPYTGISLDSCDKAVACLPYTENTEYMIIKRSGLLIRTSKDFKIAAHSRGGQGISYSNVDPNDKIIRVMPCPPALLLTSETHSLCILTEEVRSVKSASKGIRSMNLKSGQSVLNAIPMYPINNDSHTN